MKLSVPERITLLQILPKEDSYATMKILMELKMQLSFTEEELKNFKITTQDNKVSWKKSEDADMEFGLKATEIICDVLKKLDKDKKVNEQNFILFEKFIKS